MPKLINLKTNAVSFATEEELKKIERKIGLSGFQVVRAETPAEVKQLVSEKAQNKTVEESPVEPVTPEIPIEPIEGNEGQPKTRRSTKRS
jgi:hypothetical protein